MPKTSNKAAAIRAGQDLDKDDIAGLEAALKTEDGAAEYARLMKLSDRATDQQDKDAWAYRALTFWKDEYFRKGRNAFAAAQRAHNRTGTLDRSNSGDGSQFSVLDVTTGARNATDMYDPAFSDNWKIRKHRVKDKNLTRETTGYRTSERGNTDPEVNHERADVLKKLIKAVDRKGMLPHFFLLMDFWKFEVPSFLTLSKDEMAVWSRVKNAWLDTSEKRRSNIRSIAATMGIDGFILKRVTSKLRDIILKDLGMTQEEFLDLLAPVTDKAPSSGKSKEKATNKVYRDQAKRQDHDYSRRPAPNRTPVSMGESMCQFPTRADWEEELLQLASEVGEDVRGGKTDSLRVTVEDLNQMVADLQKGHIVADWSDEDVQALQSMILMAQERMYN